MIRLEFKGTSSKANKNSIHGRVQNSNEQDTAQQSPDSRSDAALKSTLVSRYTSIVALRRTHWALTEKQHQQDGESL